MYSDQPRSWFRVLLNDYGIILRNHAFRTPSLKRVPIDLRSDLPEVRRHLLAGFIDGDGHRQVNKAASYQVVIEATLAATLGADLVHVARGLGYSVGGMSEKQLAGTDEHPQPYLAFTFVISGVQEYYVPPLMVGRHPRHFPPLVPGLRHPETLPVHMTYKRVPQFLLYDGTNPAAYESCYGENYSWGFSLQRAPPVPGQATTDIGCPLAWYQPAAPPAAGVPWVLGQPVPPPHLVGPSTNYVAITVQPRPLLHPRPGEQTVMSSNFIILHNSGKGTLRLTGRGNPFAEGCGYSYINEKVTAKKPSDEFPELQEPKKKTGTNADLRKLTMEEMGAALQKLGMGADEVAKLLRWDRVRAISRLSTEAVQEGKYPNLKRFARQARPTSAKMMEEYRRDIQAIFDRELALLAWQGRPDYSHEVDDDVAAVKEKGGARKVRERQGGGGGRSEYLAQKKKEREEEDEYKDFLASREKALKQDQTGKPADKARPTDKSRATASGSPVTSTAVPSTPATGGAVATTGKKKKKVLITKLQHVIKVTNKDGSQTVHTKVYSDKDTLKDFVLDCQSAATESSSNGQRLRQRLQLNSLPVEGKKEGKEKGGKDEDEDEEGERQLKGVPQVELIPYARGTKIKTQEAYMAKYTKEGRQQAAVVSSQKGRRGWKRGEDDAEYMFTLDDDDWTRAGDPFTFPGGSSPAQSLSAGGGAAGRGAGPSSLLTSTSSGTLKLSLKQLHQTPQDVYVKSKVKRKVTAEADPSLTPVMQPYKKRVLSRKRGDPRIFLSSCLEDILKEVAELEYAAPFREPVTDDIAENYSVGSHTTTRPPASAVSSPSGAIWHALRCGWLTYLFCPHMRCSHSLRISSTIRWICGRSGANAPRWSTITRRSSWRTWPSCAVTARRTTDPTIRSASTPACSRRISRPCWCQTHTDSASRRARRPSSSTSC